MVRGCQTMPRRRPLGASSAKANRLTAVVNDGSSQTPTGEGLQRRTVAAEDLVAWLAMVLQGWVDPRPISYRTPVGGMAGFHGGQMAGPRRAAASHLLVLRERRFSGNPDPPVAFNRLWSYLLVPYSEA